MTNNLIDLMFVPLHTDNRFTVSDILKLAKKGKIEIIIGTNKKINFHAIKEDNGEITEIHNLRFSGYFTFDQNLIEPEENKKTSISYIKNIWPTWPETAHDRDFGLFYGSYKRKLYVKHRFTKYNNPDDCFESKLKLNLSNPQKGYYVMVEVDKLDQL